MQSLRTIFTNGLIILGLSFGSITSASASIASEMFEDLKISVERDGNAIDQSALAAYYSQGYGVRQDHQKSFYWDQKSAEQGYSPAQTSLAFKYLLGEGVRQNKVQAKEWFGKSCDNGYQTGCDYYRKLNEEGY